MKRGFSIIETVVYVAILAVLAVLVTNMILTMTVMFGKARTQRNVSEQGALALERILREIRLASSVVTSTSVLGTSPGQLTLNTVISPTDATEITRRFFLEGTAIKLQEGTNPETLLTSGTRVTNLTFHFLFNAAHTYYVRGSYSGCSDLATGIATSTAFCTISKAASVAKARDVIFVGAGTYTETVTPANSGVTGTPIVYFADRGGWHTGDAGAVILDGTNSRCYAFDLSAGRHYLVIDGFEATRYRDCHGGDGTFYFIGPSNNNIYRNLVAYSTRRDAFYLEGSNNILENCLGYDLGDDGFSFSSGGTGSLTPSSGNIIRNCTFTNDIGMDTGSGGYAMELWSGDGTNVFENNIFDHTIRGTDWEDETFRYNDWTQGTLAGTGNINANPSFIDAASNNFRLQQTTAGESATSPAVDAGSFFAPADAPLSLRTTRSDNVLDSGRMDMGYHYSSPLSEPFFFALGSAEAAAMRVEITLEAGSGRQRSEETFYGTAVVRRSY